MRLATRHNGMSDGEALVVSADGTRGLPAPAPSLLALMEDWAGHELALRALSVRLAAGEGEALDQASLLAPLPRSWQWLDGSAFGTHGQLMQIAFGLPPIETDRPLMYQGLSDRFLASGQPARFPSEADGIDFEGEFGVIVDAVPMGITPEAALAHIRLVVLINDWSLRAIAPIEMKTGFGWVQAKPACAMAPFALTPEALGPAWRDGRVAMALHVERDGQPFSHAHGGAMDFGFHELIAHAARTRDLVAGTIIGSGTVSNADYARVGSSCISEVRAIEIIHDGVPATPFLSFGERVRMEGRHPDGTSPFGVLEQVVTSVNA